MTTPRSALVVPVATVLLGAGLAGCGSQPAVCDDVAALQTSVDNLKHVRPGEKALATIGAELRTIRPEIEQLRRDASGQYASEIDTVTSRAAALGSSLDAATSQPSAPALTRVADDVRSFGSAVNDLATTVGETC